MWAFSVEKKKRKKGRMDNPEGIACPTANRTSDLTFDRRRWVISCGSKSLFDMLFWMYYSERTDTQCNFTLRLLIEIKYTETDKIGYSRFISIQIRWKQDDTHRDWEGWIETKYSHFYYFSVNVFSTKVPGFSLSAPFALSKALSDLTSTSWLDFFFVANATTTL